MARALEERTDRRAFDDQPRVEDGHFLAMLGDDAEVAGDQYGGRPELVDERLDEIEDFGAWIVTSSPLVGSSAMSNRGSLERAIAMVTRWAIPPLS